MVKIYKNSMPRAYTYSKAGTYTLKILGNIDNAVFSGESNNGLTNALIEVSKLDGNITALGDNAFIRCTNLKKVNISDSNVQRVGANAFSQCSKLNELCYNTSLQKFGSSCFSQSGLSVVAPRSYEQDVEVLGEYSYIQSELTSIGDSAFDSASKMQCIVVPEKVQLKTQDQQDLMPTYSSFLKNAPSMQHIVFLGLDSSTKEKFFDDILKSGMFGLRRDITFEGKSDDIPAASVGTDVYRYKHSEDIESREIQTVVGMTSMFNIQISDQPADSASMQPKNIYRYDAVLVDYCIDNSLDFIVVCIDSKTSAKSKLMSMVQSINDYFYNAAPTAIVFLLDRHNANGETRSFEVEHYRKTLMDEISRKQMLVHSSTNPHTVLDFPEISFVAKKGLKFQKLHLDPSSPTEMISQLKSAAGNIFN